jgi:hypothetical protein
MKIAAKAGLALAVMLCAWRMQAGTDSSAATIRSVHVLGAGNTLEVEVVASRPIQPQAQVITGPDRLILDFPNAVPDGKLRTVNVDRGELKQVRVGRFSSNPPVTRVVLDLKSAQPYQLFPAGKTVIVKLATAPVNQVQPSMPAAAAAPVVPIAPPRKVEVNFSHGKLRIWANKATLAEVMAEVHRSTGAEMTMPAGSGQDPIIADLGPAPAREVLAALLYGSPFNFVIVGTDNDPSQLRGIFLTMRQGDRGEGGGVSYPAIQAAQTQPVPDQAMSSPEVETPPEAAPNNAEPDMAPNQPQPEEAAPPQ